MVPNMWSCLQERPRKNTVFEIFSYWSWKQLTSLPFSPVDRFTQVYAESCAQWPSTPLPSFIPGFIPPPRLLTSDANVVGEHHPKCVFSEIKPITWILGVILYIYAIFKKKTLGITNIFETTKPVAVSTYESIWQPCTKNRNPAASSTGQCWSTQGGSPWLAGKSTIYGSLSH